MSEETKVQESAAAETISQEAMDNFVSLKKGDTVKGTIVKIEDNQAFVSLGYKYDGVIPLRELSSVQLENAADAVQVGQEVELKVVSIDDEKEKLFFPKSNRWRERLGTACKAVLKRRSL